MSFLIEHLWYWLPCWIVGFLWACIDTTRSSDAEGILYYAELFLLVFFWWVPFLVLSLSFFAYLAELFLDKFRRKQ